MSASASDSVRVSASVSVSQNVSGRARDGVSVGS